jgi:hypothetical protein
MNPQWQQKRGWDAIESLYRQQDKKDRHVEQEQKKLNDEYDSNSKRARKQ